MGLFCTGKISLLERKRQMNSRYWLQHLDTPEEQRVLSAPVLIALWGRLSWVLLRVLRGSAGYGHRPPSLVAAAGLTSDSGIHGCGDHVEKARWFLLETMVVGLAPGTALPGSSCVGVSLETQASHSQRSSPKVLEYLRNLNSAIHRTGFKFLKMIITFMVEGSEKIICI